MLKVEKSKNRFIVFSHVKFPVIMTMNTFIRQNDRETDRKKRTQENTQKP